MDLIELQTDDPHWAEFLEGHEHQVFHRPEYKQFIEETFQNTKAHYFAIADKKIKIIFPLFYVDQPWLRKIFFSPFFDIFKPKLTSAAFHDFGGPIGELKPEYMIKLFNHIKETYSIDNVEIKDNNPLFNKLVKRKNYRKFVISLENKEQVWRNIQKSKRKAVKKAQREGITTREVQKKEINKLYKTYLENMRAFGELPYPKRYFINFYENFIEKGLGKCFGAYYGNKLVSVLLGYTVKDNVHIVIAVSEKKYLELRPNDAVHWQFIEWACDNGYKYFDFGRTRPESGQYDYKRKWGGKIEELTTNYLPIKTKNIPTIDPTNPKYQLFIKIEQHLPLWFTKYISSWFREGLGM